MLLEMRQQTRKDANLDDAFVAIEFLVNKKEMGHLHDERLADLPFPIEVRKELVASGSALPHHIYPESGWVSY